MKEVSTSSSIDYLNNISTETRVPIDRHKLTVTGTGGVYFKSQTSIFTYLLINISMERQNGGGGTSVGQQTQVCIDRTDRKDAPRGRTVAITDRT